MLRSLYSGVSGINSYQKGIDVVGNNISNINTTAFKSSSAGFGDLLYQTMRHSDGATTTRTSTNVKEVGLGVAPTKTQMSILKEGAAQTTNDLLDFRISEVPAFFVVQENDRIHYTRDGSFSIDANGDLVMGSTGYYVMGWSSVDGRTIDTNRPLDKLHIVDQDDTARTISEPTTYARIEGTIDSKDMRLYGTGTDVTVKVYDNNGKSFDVTFAFTNDGDDDDFTQDLSISKIVDADGNAVPVSGDKFQCKFNPDTRQLISAAGNSNGIINMNLPAAFGKQSIRVDVTKLSLIQNTEPDVKINGGLPEWVVVDKGLSPTSDENGYMSGKLKMKDGEHVSTTVDFSDFSQANKSSLYDNGFYFTCCTCDRHYSIKFTQGNEINEKQSGRHYIYEIGIDDIKSGRELVDRIVEATGGQPLDHFTNLTGNGSVLTLYDNRSGVYPYDGTGLFGRGYATQKAINYDTMIAGLRGDANGREAGREPGHYTGYSVDNAGMIFAEYSNGAHVVKGQMAVAEFLNPTGLESIGKNCYDATLNSGEAQDDLITNYDGHILSGQLEMSNVDLSEEMSQMIILQRAFQANSRVVTTSDQILEVTKDLKR